MKVSLTFNEIDEEQAKFLLNAQDLFGALWEFHNWIHWEWDEGEQESIKFDDLWEKYKEFLGDYFEVIRG